MIVGPGPGDPRDGDDPKMATLRARRRRAARARSSRSWRCASGTRRCATSSGIPLAYKDIVFQGTQSPVAIDGRTERVGFYNTFVGRAGGDAAARRRRGRDRPGDRRHPPASRGPHYRGIQFHAESILTEHGYDLLHDLVLAPCSHEVAGVTAAPDVVVVDHHDSYT